MAKNVTKKTVTRRRDRKNIEKVQLIFILVLTIQ